MDVDLTQNLMKLLNEPHGRVAFVVYCLACFIGQVGHATWLWLKKEVPCVLDRFREDPRASAVSIITNFGVIAGMAVLIPFEAMPLQAAVIMGLTQGFSSDSALNKNPKAIWTDAQREAARAAKTPTP